MSSNPYQTPAAVADEGVYVRLDEIMTVGKAIKIVLATAALCGLGGLGIGLLIGAAMPDYYRAMFDAARQPGFNIVALGAGLGLSQGVGGGLVVGLVLVAILCWFRSRIVRAARREQVTGAND